jgi:CBS domain-containing protein
MELKAIEDIMVPVEDYPCVSETQTLREAIEELGKVQIVRGDQASLPRVVLVFDDGFTRLLGLLGRRDILRGLEPRFLVSESLQYQRKLFTVEIDPNLSEMSYDKIIAGIRERSKRPVKNYMVPFVGSIEYNDHLMKAIYEMVAHNISLLPVVKNRRIVGVVRSVDVLNEVTLLLSA